MAHCDSKEDKVFLENWLLSRRLQDTPVAAQEGTLASRVTVLLYFFRRSEDVERWWPLSEQALRETWRHCGLLKTVVVTDCESEPLRAFSSRHPNVTIQVECVLCPGDVDSLSVDCNARLFQRFDTDYVLTVQDDGFPLRPGLEKFVGKYDFIGAPWRRKNLLGLAAGTLLRDWPMNGGFSLRSRRFCRLVAENWKAKYSQEEYKTSRHGDDIFCTMTLPRENRRFQREMSWPNCFVASSFSYEASFRENRTKNPLGFHGATAFCELLDRGAE